MAREELNSDRVNYLIWQYLQEAGYRNAAVTLQADWQCPDPQQLDFAPYVQPRTLISSLQRGLLYNEAERRACQARGDGLAISGFFGPVAPLSPPQMPYENGLKRSVEQRDGSDLAAEASSKRARLSPGRVVLAPDSTAMEVDEVVLPNDQNGHAYPSPQEAEEPDPITLTSGPARSTQVEKVADLMSHTTFLNLTDSSSSSSSNNAGAALTAATNSSLVSNSTASATATTTAPTATRSPVLLHCEWNPRDASILAAAGTDALARLWTIPRGAAPGIGSDAEGHVPAVSSHNIMDDNIPSNSTVTALAWSSDGAAIAIATNAEDTDSAKITVWVIDGAKRFQFDDLEPPVLSLKWSPSDSMILALVSDGQSSAAQLFSPLAGQSKALVLPENAQGLDAAWIGDNEFVVCGSDFLWAFSCEDEGIRLSRKLETQSDAQLIYVKGDLRTQLIAAASENGLLSVWNVQGERKSVVAHDGTIVALAWQPVPETMMDLSTERLVATCGDDGMISVWNAIGDMRKPKCSMTMEGALVAMSFTPDGTLIAGATSNQILIWSVADTTTPRARWVRGSETGWQSPRIGDDALQEEDQHCLSWDAEGQKLAFGVNSLLAVISGRVHEAA